MFALYISHYLTFALHSVGQGPVSLYNNFICAKGFPQHFNGPSPVHTSWPSRTVTRGAACYGYKPVTAATTARCSATFAIKTPKTPNAPSNSFEQNKWRLRASHSQNHFPKTHYSQRAPSRFLHRSVGRLAGGNIRALLRDTKLQATTAQSFVVT